MQPADGQFRSMWKMMALEWIRLMRIESSNGFFRGEDPLVLATPGTGLGLAIVKQLVMMHKGASG